MIHLYLTKNTNPVKKGEPLCQRVIPKEGEYRYGNF